MSKIGSHPASTILGPATPTKRADGRASKVARISDAPCKSALGSAALIKNSGSCSFGAPGPAKGYPCLTRRGVRSAAVVTTGSGSTVTLRPIGAAVNALGVTAVACSRKSLPERRLRSSGLDPPPRGEPEDAWWSRHATWGLGGGGARGVLRPASFPAIGRRIAGRNMGLMMLRSGPDADA